MNENDLAFFLYLNVEILRVLLIFSINKILTSSCDLLSFVLNQNVFLCIV